MLKTRAYFCHTVAEGSPLSRITSNLFNQARQSLEKVFNRSGRADGIIPKQPVLKQYGGKASSGGIVAQIHANSRGLITKFAERNLTSELVNAMKQKYGWSGGFRSGIWGQKLSTFAFVGIGVAAGAQWNTFEGKILHDQLPYIVELFGKRQAFGAPEKVTKIEELETLPLEREFDLEMPPLNLTEYDSEEPSFILLSELSFDENERGFVDNQEENSDDGFTGMEMPEESVDTLLRIDEKSEQELMAHLSVNLAKVEEQRAELNSVQASLMQLNDLLRELVGSSELCVNVESLGPSFVEIELLPSEGDGLRERSMKQLSLIGRQQLQLNAVKQALLLQNQQLQDLCEAAVTARPSVIRSSFSKRDACCGPGVRQ